MGAQDIRIEPKPNLIDVIIILVISSAIALFAFWLATRTLDRNTFEQLPEWLKGSYSAVFSVLTGATGIGAAVLHELRRPPNTSPDYLKLIGRCLIALFAMIAVIILIFRFASPAPTPSTPTSSPTPIPTPTSTPPQLPVVRNLTHRDVSREGTMHDISVTVIKRSNGTGTFSVRFKWSGGTWSGSQTATISFMGKDHGALQSLPIPIDRSGCFYGGGNLQTKDGELTVDPDLITDIEVTLSEVKNRTEGGC
jgi:hypothetical protein